MRFLYAFTSKCSKIRKFFNCFRHTRIVRFEFIVSVSPQVALNFSCFCTGKKNINKTMCIIFSTVLKRLNTPSNEKCYVHVSKSECQYSFFGWEFEFNFICDSNKAHIYYTTVWCPCVNRYPKKWERESEWLRETKK